MVKIPAHVVVVRGGSRLKPPTKRIGQPQPPESPSTTSTSTTTTSRTTPPARSSGLYLKNGDEIRVGHSASIRFSYAGNTYRITAGQIRLECRHLKLAPHRTASPTAALAIHLESGRVQVRSGSSPRRALVLTHEMLTFATARNTNFVADRHTRARWTHAWTRNHLIVAASAAKQTLRINTRASYTAIADRRGLRLDIWPFSISSLQRATTRADHLSPFWADGTPCSAGCPAPGVIAGWPLKPFHQQHAIRAGINEIRPANFHVGVDIQANNFEPVYAIQSGTASWSPTGSYGDYRVAVGTFTYWHILPRVSQGQHVIAYKTPIGNVLNGFGHIAFSEGPSYLNPLRPGGPLRPYTDTEPPIIGTPRIFADGRVIVGSFDPQSSIHQQHYETPVLAPSSLAWRLYDAHGHGLTGLHWAMRGSQHYATGLKPVIFAPGASNPGFNCFYTRVRCIPNWVYWLAGGLTQPLPLGSLRPGRYRLAVYAWDWAGNRAALDDWIRLPLAGAASAGSEFGPLAPNFDYDETGPPDNYRRSGGVEITWRSR